tara:strand:- start:77 stop:637 length:561 start_codon:yes stop_codon:yes gene_type:complete
MARYKTKVKSERFFITGSSRAKKSDTILTSSFNKMSESFASNEYLDDSNIWESQGAVIYQLQNLKDDIDDLHAEVSSSVYESQINSGSFVSEIKTFTARDTTPSVKNGHLFKTANDRGISITEFDDGAAGQQITIIIKDGNTGFTHDRSKLFLNGGNNVLRFVSGDTISFVYDGTTWYETNRSDNT